jgi:hypothetical protein
VLVVVVVVAVVAVAVAVLVPVLASLCAPATMVVPRVVAVCGAGPRRGGLRHQVLPPRRGLRVLPPR